MCPSPHNIGPNPPNMVKHSALSIVPTEYIEKIHQLLLGATKSRGFVGDVGYVGTVSLWVSYVGLWVSYVGLWVS